MRVKTQKKTTLALSRQAKIDVKGGVFKKEKKMGSTCKQVYNPITQQRKHNEPTRRETYFTLGI